MHFKNLLQKSGLATLEVAQILAGLRPGDRIPTITQLGEQCGLARGNIQIALNNLKQSQLIQLESHGQQGTLVTRIDYQALARYCGQSDLLCVLPMPYALRHEGLASGLFSELNQGGITGTISFMRESAARLRCVQEQRFHLCVMSRFACDHYQAQGCGIQPVAEFGPQSYVEQHRIFVRPGFDGRWEGCRVGIDENSADQKLLTQAFFADKKVQYLPIAYSQLVPLLRSGALDAGLWSTDILPEELDSHPIPQLEGTHANTTAVLVCRQNDNITAQLVRTLLDPARVIQIQRQVMNQELFPRY